jgi:hypothetical protein
MKALKLLILATGMLMFVACDYGNESNVDDYSVDSNQRLIRLQITRLKKRKALIEIREVEKR